MSELICLKPVLQVIAKSGDRIKIENNILTIPPGYIWLERIDNETNKNEREYNESKKEWQEDEIKLLNKDSETKLRTFFNFPSMRFPNQTSSHFGIVHAALCQKLESLHQYGSHEPLDRPVSEPIRHSEEFAYLVPTFEPLMRFPKNAKKYNIGHAIESDEQTQANEIEFKMKFIEELKSR